MAREYSIALVGCGSLKGNRPAAARHLYRSTLFRWSLQMAEASADRVVIASALHGAVDPDRQLDPYDAALGPASREQRRAWAADIVATLGPADARPVLLLAGGAYEASLQAALVGVGWTVWAPLHGLQVGERLHLLKLLRLAPAA